MLPAITMPCGYRHPQDDTGHTTTNPQTPTTTEDRPVSTPGSNPRNTAAELTFTEERATR